MISCPISIFVGPILFAIWTCISLFCSCSVRLSFCYYYNILFRSRILGKRAPDDWLLPIGRRRNDIVPTFNFCRSDFDPILTCIYLLIFFLSCSVRLNLVPRLFPLPWERGWVRLVLLLLYYYIILYYIIIIRKLAILLFNILTRAFHKQFCINSVCYLLSHLPAHESLCLFFIF